MFNNQESFFVNREESAVDGGIKFKSKPNLKSKPMQVEKFSKKSAPIKKKKAASVAKQNLNAIKKEYTIKYYKKLYGAVYDRQLYIKYDSDNNKIMEIDRVFVPQLVDKILLSSYDVRKDIGIIPSIDNYDKIKDSFLLPLLPSYRSLESKRLKVIGDEKYDLNPKDLSISSGDIGDKKGNMFPYINIKGKVKLNVGKLGTKDWITTKLGADKKKEMIIGESKIPVKFTIIPLVFTNDFMVNLEYLMSDDEINVNSVNHIDLQIGLAGLYDLKNDTEKFNEHLNNVRDDIKRLFYSFLVLEKLYREIEAGLEKYKIFADNFWNLSERNSAYNLKNDASDEYSHQKLYGIFDSPLFVGTFDSIGDKFEKVINDGSNNASNKKKKDLCAEFMNLIQYINEVRSKETKDSFFFGGRKIGGKKKGQFHKNYLIVMNLDFDSEGFYKAANDRCESASAFSNDNISSFISQISWNLHEKQQNYGMYHGNINAVNLKLEATNKKSRVDIALIGERNFINRDVISWKRENYAGTLLSSIFGGGVRNPAHIRLNIFEPTAGFINYDGTIPLLDLTKIDWYQLGFSSPRIIRDLLKQKKRTVQRFEDDMWSTGVVLLGMLLCKIVRNKNRHEYFGIKQWQVGKGLNILSPPGRDMEYNNMFFKLYKETGGGIIDRQINSIVDSILVAFNEAKNVSSNQEALNRIRKENKDLFHFADVNHMANYQLNRDDLTEYITILIGMILYKMHAKNKGKIIDNVKIFKDNASISSHSEDMFADIYYRSQGQKIMHRRNVENLSAIVGVKNTKEEIELFMYMDKRGNNDGIMNTYNFLMGYNGTNRYNFNGGNFESFFGQELGTEVYRLFLYNLSSVYDRFTASGEIYSGSRLEIIKSASLVYVPVVIADKETGKSTIKYDELNIYEYLTNKLYELYPEYMDILNSLLRFKQKDRALGESYRKTNQGLTKVFFPQIFGDKQLVSYFNPVQKMKHREQAETSKEILTNKNFLYTGSYTLAGYKGEHPQIFMHDYYSILHNIIYEEGLYNRKNWKSKILRKSEISEKYEYSSSTYDKEYENSIPKTFRKEEEYIRGYIIDIPAEWEENKDIKIVAKKSAQPNKGDGKKRKRSDVIESDKKKPPKKMRRI